MKISTTAHTRALCIIACFSGLLLSGCAAEADDDSGIESVTQGVASDIAVYTDKTLASPWQSWSWSSTVAVANADAPLRSGSTSQIKTIVKSAYGALSLAHTTSDLPLTDYEAITFHIRGTASSRVIFTLETLSGDSSGGAEAVVPVTTTWTTQTIKLDAPNGTLAKFGKLNWMGPKAGQTFYIDNVKLVAKKAATAPTAPTASPATSPTFPTTPLSVTKGNVVTLSSSASPYFLFVPSAYDASHKTPTKLLVWLHGCGGQGQGDAWTVSPGGTQSWLTVSVGGRDGACWKVGTDSTLVLAALDDVKKRLNVDPRKVVIGGYSSGGDLAYRTAFYNADRFAGVIAENTSPFRDSGSTQAASIAAASWKLNIVQLAHLGDTVYPIAKVRAETDALKTAGFPITRLERAGTHWDADTATAGTSYDLRKYLLPYLDAGWLSPQ